MKLLLVVMFLVGIIALCTGCGSSYPNRLLVGEPFPSVTGKSLSGQEIHMPDFFKGKKAIVVLGYEQNTQFDIDRWSIGFFTANFDLPPVYEVPTIPGLLPSLFKEQIDGGMRSGIPAESWKDVITVYGGDGSTLVRWTGNEVKRNCRVLLLDENGTVLWAHDKGFGLPPLKSLIEALKLDPKNSEIR